MKLKLEPNVLTKYSKEGVLDEDVNYAKVSYLHSLLTPHLKMVPSIQVPIEKSENSKGFFNRKQVNHTIGKHCLSLLDLTEKSLDLSGKKKASLPLVHKTFPEESFFMTCAFLFLVNRGSSLSSSILTTPN